MGIVCNICGSNALKIFDAMILGKYKTGYFQCEHCKFIQTESPYWLDEAYVHAIASLDVGLIFRNVESANIIPSILDEITSEDDSYIDYGGGYGMFVRMMRDKGYKFYLQDIYAENMFAKHFTVNDYKQNQKYACLTAFEVFEHLEHPEEELKKMLAYSDTIIFSTILQTSASFKDASEWWYFVPETGQHISFYTRKSLEILGEKFALDFYTNDVNLHLFTRKKLNDDPFISKPGEKIPLIIRALNKVLRTSKKVTGTRKSLLQQDFELYRSYLHK